MRKFVTAAAVFVCTWTVTAASAWAQGDGEKIGDNVGKLLGGWA